MLFGQYWDHDCSVKHLFVRPVSNCEQYVQRLQVVDYSEADNHSQLPLINRLTQVRLHPNKDKVLNHAHPDRHLAQPLPQPCISPLNLIHHFSRRIVTPHQNNQQETAYL
jgi:hypothetical protein